MRNHQAPGLILLSLLLLASMLLSGCGAATDEPRAEIDIPSASSESTGSDINTQEPEFEGAPVQEAELPAGFPASFPIPAEARIGSTLGVGGEGEFRVFLSLTTPLEESLAWYQGELVGRGWTLDEQAETSRGTEWTISNPEYEGELLFVEADTGVVLDVHLTPSGSTTAQPEIPEGLGEASGLGTTGSSFPADFPIPTSYTPIELPDRARSEGYELAFTSSSMTEMAMVDLNVAVMTAGWEIGEPAVDAASGVYVIPFVNPASGFQGYASILRDGSSYGLDAGSVLILMAPGTP